ncbi:hypothetical protein J27TS7_16370 [Paenibacillus dendritiformis]|uniref:hypothetical protein n=1 Tax=Paenibacillus dendritiformis TaxID=130049 RepID=UPI001B0BDE12|nr:hypothetical protein [Paenibacillus dendritiformis]GIO72123.1 hypothetical protein J27TS7_16370 [Paenibacillus dendritiformis]
MMRELLFDRFGTEKSRKSEVTDKVLLEFKNLIASKPCTNEINYGIELAKGLMKINGYDEKIIENFREGKILKSDICGYFPDLTMNLSSFDLETITKLEDAGFIVYQIFERQIFRKPNWDIISTYLTSTSNFELVEFSVVHAIDGVLAFEVIHDENGIIKKQNFEEVCPLIVNGIPIGLNY